MPDVEYEIPRLETVFLRSLAAALPWSSAGRARRRLQQASVEPPLPVPPGRTAVLPGRGEIFYRDSGGDGPVVLLLHGWIVSADLNWIRCYAPLTAAGYRVVAVDHRGHGRGLRSTAPFRLTDCAADAAALIEQLDCGPVTAAGYSMGGPITQLLARNHRERLNGIVLCATSREWQDREVARVWRTMGMLRIMLGLSAPGLWRTLMEVSGLPEDETTAWVLAEISRGNPRDLAEAGRELGRFDSRPWLAELTTPAVVVVTSRDRSVPPRNQRALAEQLGAPAVEVAADHMAPGEADSEFPAGLLEALAQVRGGAGAPVVSVAAAS